MSKYFENREKILEQAKRERERLAALDEAERKRAIEAKLNKNTVRTRYNDSMYLDSHVTQVKQMKLFTYFMYDYFKYETEGAPVGGKSQNFLANISAALGIAEDLELRLDLSSILYNKFDYYGFDVSNKKKTMFFNPILSVKWRVLKNETHGINLSLSFGLQLALADTTYSGTIFNAMNFGSTHAFHFGLYIDKTIGKFTPFIGADFSIERQYKGKYMYNYLISTGYDITGLGNDHHFSLISKIGFEVRFNSWFIIQPSFSFSYSSEVETWTGSSSYWFIDDFYQYSPSIKFIFKVSRVSAFSISYMHIFSTDLISKSGTSLLKSDIKTSFKIFCYFATAISL